MFKLGKEPTFNLTIKVTPPGDAAVEETLQGKFRVLSVDQINEYDLTQPEQTLKLLLDATIELSDIVDLAGEPLPWTDEVRDRLFALPYLRMPLAAQYLKAVIGARAGN